MKKFGVINAVSFLSYPAVLFASPYVTARSWADLCLLLFAVSVLYQLVYIIFLRRKEGISAGRSLIDWFMYMLSGLSIYLVINYYYVFVYGYAQYNFLHLSRMGTYYGMSAMKESGWIYTIFVPVGVIIYWAARFIINKRQKRKG